MLQYVRVPGTRTNNVQYMPLSSCPKRKRKKREERRERSEVNTTYFAFRFYHTFFHKTKTTTTNKLLPTSTIIKRIVFLVNIELQIHLIKCIWTSIYHLDFSSIYILSRDCLVDPIIFDWSDTIIQDSRKYHHCYIILKI